MKNFFRYYFIKVTANFNVLIKNLYDFIIIINQYRTNHYHLATFLLWFGSINNSRCNYSYENLNIVMSLIRYPKRYY